MISYAGTVYNKGPFLTRVLKAIDQEWQRTGGEVILVNDGSTDNSRDIIDAFADSRPYVRAIHQLNSGVAAATNAAVALCRENFIRLVDGDDLLIPGSTHALLEAVRSTGCGSAFGTWGRWDLQQPPDALTTQGHVPVLVADPLMKALKSQLFVPSSLLLGRGDALRCFPLDASFRTSQDFTLSLRLARLGPLASVPVPVCLMGRNENGLSKSMAVMYADSICILAMHWRNWPEKYQRYAVRRMALRTYLYASRHLSVGLFRLSALQVMRFLSYFPFSFDDENLEFIRRCFDQALRSPKEYP